MNTIIDSVTQGIIELYIQLKQRIRHQQSMGAQMRGEDPGSNEIDIDEERGKLSGINPAIIVEYIKSSFDILLNLRVEDALQEERIQQEEEEDNRHQHGPKKPKKRQNQHSEEEEEDEQHYINSSRGGHGAHDSDMIRPAESIPASSIGSSREGSGPPKVYEEIIQGLEADVRKHIRIEQQLKLHIETVEGRLDELESDNERLIMECQAKGDLEWQFSKQVETLEAELLGARQENKDNESKHSLELRSI